MDNNKITYSNVRSSSVTSVIGHHINVAPSPIGGQFTKEEIPTVNETEFIANVKDKLEKLEKAGDSAPLKEFFRGHLSELHEQTTSSDKLATELYALHVLTDYDRKKVLNEEIEQNKNQIIYDVVGTKGKIDEFLIALKNSENDHILAKLDKWAKEN